MFHKGGRMAGAATSTDLHGYGDAIRKELSSRIPADEKLSVLDVGTGFGINVQFLARRLAKGSEIWTVDPSKEVLDGVRSSLDKEVAGLVRFAKAEAEDMRFEDGFFDVVVSVMVLHHLVRLEPALAEMGRVLKPGGSLLVVDYKPEASRDLEFKAVHEEKDFFRPSQVLQGVRRAGLSGRVHDNGLWYLVEARKAEGRAPRRGGRARPARRRRAARGR